MTWKEVILATSIVIGIFVGIVTLLVVTNPTDPRAEQEEWCTRNGGQYFVGPYAHCEFPPKQ